MPEPPSLSPALFPINSQLVPIAVVRTLRGISADSVQSLVDSGELRFVWNIGLRGPRATIPDLRLWLREVIQPISVASMDLPAALALILGANRTRFRGTEIGQLLMICRPQMHRLYKSRAIQGKITNRTLWVARPTLEQFLAERFVAG